MVSREQLKLSIAGSTTDVIEANQTERSGSSFMDAVFRISNTTSLHGLAQNLVNWTEYRVALPEIWLRVDCTTWTHCLSPSEIENAWENCETEAIEKYEDPALLMYNWFTAQLEPLWPEIQRQIHSGT